MSNIVKVVAQGAAVVPDNAITEDEIAPSSISDEHVSATADIDPTKIDGTAVVESRQVNTGTGLTGGGDLSTNRTIAIADSGVDEPQIADEAVTPSKLDRQYAEHRTVGNLLSANVANGTDELGTTFGFNSSGGGIALSTSTQIAWYGTRSLRAQANGTGVQIVGCQTSGTVSVDNGFIAVDPGEQLHAEFRIYTSDATSFWAVRVYFYNSSGTLLSSQQSSSISGAASWQVVARETIAPAEAKYALVTAYRASGADGGVAYLDGFGAWKGVGGQWAMPGVPITGLAPTDNTITSSSLVNGTIVDEDINSSANIQPTKVSGTAVVHSRQVSAGTGLTGGGDLSTNRTISIANEGVDTPQLAPGSVTDDKLAVAKVNQSDVGNQVPGEVWSGTGGWSAVSGSVAYISGAAVFTSDGGASPRVVLETTGIAASPGELWTGIATIANTSSNNVTLRLLGATLISGGAIVPAGTTATVSFTGIAPSGTTSIRLYILGTSTPNGEGWSVSKPSLHRGAGGDAIAPGTPTTGLNLRQEPGSAGVSQIYQPAKQDWVQLPVAPIGNMLTSDEANGIAAQWQGTKLDCTVTDATSTVTPYRGTHTFALTRVASPSSTVMYTSQGIIPSTTYGATVIPGQLYTFSMYVRGDVANASQGNAQIYLVYRKSNGDAISTPVSTLTAVSESEWRRIVLISQAPADAATAQIRTYFSSLVSNHIVYVSGVQINVGAGGEWSLPGIPTTGLNLRQEPGSTDISQIYQPAKQDWVQLPVAPIGNMLTSDEANGIAAQWQGTRLDCTVTDAGGTPSPAAGSSVFKLTRVGSPSYSFMYTQQGTSPSETYGAPVVPGQWYTFSMYVRGDAANAAQGNVAVQVVFRSAAGATVSVPTSGVTAVSASEWRRLVYVVQAPDTAAVAQIRTYCSSLVSNHIIYVSGVQINVDAGGLWSPPGIPTNGVGRYVDESVGRRVFEWDDYNSRWQMTYGDTGWRNITENLTSFASAGNAYIRRQNDVVNLYLANLALDESFTSGSRIVDISTTGFAPFGTYLPNGKHGASETTSAQTWSNGIILHAEPAPLSTIRRYQWTWITNHAWPNSLPGIASGSIPS